MFVMVLLHECRTHSLSIRYINRNGLAEWDPFHEAQAVEGLFAILAEGLEMGTKDLFVR